MRTNISLLKYLLLSFIVIGFFLGFINFLHFRSLWLDEAMLALNIVNKPINELFEPLDHNQVAPIGFLVIEKIFSYLFGNTDWSLRVFTMLSFLASIFLIYFLSLKIMKEKIFALFTTALFSLNFFIISYSTEVKQYMSDVMICLIILLATINFIEKYDRKQLYIYSLIGVISIWFSNISIILLFSASLCVFYIFCFRNKIYLQILLLIGSWFISFGIYYFLFIHNHPAKSVMIRYWSNANAFIPQNILSVDFYFAIYSKIKLLFRLLGHNLLSLGMIPFFTIGLFFFGKKNKELLFILVLPIIIHFFLAYLKLYPFDSRLILYITPILIIIIVTGIYYSLKFFTPKAQIILSHLIVIPLIINLVFVYKTGYPIEKEEIKKPLEYLNTKILKGDYIYVYYAASPAFSFYQKRYTEILKTDEKNIIVSSGNRENWSKYEKDISKIRGSVWILFSHIYWEKNEKGLTEEYYILDLFRKNRFKVIEKHTYHGASIYKAISL